MIEHHLYEEIHSRTTQNDFLNRFSADAVKPVENQFSDLSHGAQYVKIRSDLKRWD